MGIGVRTYHEAHDGAAGLEMIRTQAPDVVILDWEMPGLNGAGFVRMVRSPDTFPLSRRADHHAHRPRRALARDRGGLLGVNEFLLKPVSTNALRDRLLAVLCNPRKMVSSGNYYGPEPRKLATAIHADRRPGLANLVMLN